MWITFHIKIDAKLAVIPFKMSRNMIELDNKFRYRYRTVIIGRLQLFLANWSCAHLVTGIDEVCDANYTRHIDTH